LMLLLYIVRLVNVTYVYFLNFGMYEYFVGRQETSFMYTGNRCNNVTLVQISKLMMFAVCCVKELRKKSSK
jgi:hypothetical protein